MTLPKTFGEYFMNTNPEMVDAVLEDALQPEDKVLQRIRQSTERSEIPDIEVSALQAKMLELLVRTAKAKNVLEIGTLAGYSTVALARGLGPVGTVTTLEYEPMHATVAKVNLLNARLSHTVEVIEGDAHQSLQKLSLDIDMSLRDPFDFIFIDADKESNLAYTQWALKIGTPDVTIVVDNVIRMGRVVDPGRPEKYEFIKFLGENQDLDCTVIQTVGAKGWDGFVLARRKGE